LSQSEVEEKTPSVSNRKPYGLLTGNLAGSTDDVFEKINEWAQVARELDMRQAADRRKLVREFVRILGDRNARRIGLYICDANGLPQYGWPKRTPVKAAKDGTPGPQDPKETADMSLRNATSRTPDLLPPFKDALRGSNPVRVRNPNTFAVAVGIRSGEKGRNFDVLANGVETIYVQNGRYDIYFVYSDRPDALFQGDSFTLNDNGVEIQIVKIVNGNYNIRQVK
jgi:hypothetical protein